MATHLEHHQPRSNRRTVWIAFCAFAAIAAVLLWEEHRAHVLGVIPYLLLLSCPLIHLLMHRGHGGHSGHGGRS